ncbi:MAG: IS110 family transposase [Firmicutes bacterium]|nr:transposase [Alicyclobacillaceae bacterium]MCL6497329.1 IS110 family transposase [Bacillota bacterium]
MGDPHRFRSSRQVTRDAGVDPSVQQSGEADGRGHTSHQGPAELCFVNRKWLLSNFGVTHR